MKPLKLSLSAVVALSCIIACSSDDETPAPEKKDVQLACNDLCRASGFTNARKDEATTVSCFCSVGNASAKVEAAACTKMCTDIGKAKGEPFGADPADPDSCKCS